MGRGWVSGGGAVLPHVAGGEVFCGPSASAGMAGGPSGSCRSPPARRVGGAGQHQRPRWRVPAVIERQPAFGPPSGGRTPAALGFQTHRPMSPPGRGPRTLGSGGSCASEIGSSGSCQQRCPARTCRLLDTWLVEACRRWACAHDPTHLRHRPTRHAPTEMRQRANCYRWPTTAEQVGASWASAATGPRGGVPATPCPSRSRQHDFAGYGEWRAKPRQPLTGRVAAPDAPVREIALHRRFRIEPYRLINARPSSRCIRLTSCAVRVEPGPPQSHTGQGIFSIEAPRDQCGSQKPKSNPGDRLQKPHV